MIENWLPMDTAPKTGATIIGLVVTFGWNSDVCQHVATGHKAIEIWWTTGMGTEEKSWQEWCGDPKTRSTGQVVPVGWIPMPGKRRPSPIRKKDRVMLEGCSGPYVVKTLRKNEAYVVSEDGRSGMWWNLHKMTVIPS